MIQEREAIALLKKHIPDQDLKKRVIAHCTLVKDIAMRIAKGIPGINLEMVRNGALLHDIGRMGCPPKTEKAVMHGVKGAVILREEGKLRDKENEFEAYARIAERHLGAGMKKEDVERQNLPLPKRDFIPETPEEKVITVADNLVEKGREVEIGTTVKRFTEEIGEEAGRRTKELYDEVMDMKE